MAASKGLLLPFMEKNGEFDKAEAEARKGMEEVFRLLADANVVVNDTWHSASEANRERFCRKLTEALNAYHEMRRLVMSRDSALTKLFVAVGELSDVGLSKEEINLISPHVKML